MTPDLKPVKGMVVLHFLDDDDEPSTNGGYPSTEQEKTCLAQVVAAGPETSVKKGQVVLVREYARRSPEVGKGMVIADSYSILAVVATA